ncbi:MAG: hypothetical protein GX754_04475 [Clostridiaceae bacterium]|nr:hypothetical protein [Clostridiaceae bacterium]
MPYLAESQRAGIIGNLNQNKKQLRLAEVKLEEGILSATFREVLFPLRQEEMREYLDHVTNLLKEQDVCGVEKCSRCGKEGRAMRLCF